MSTYRIVPTVVCDTYFNGDSYRCAYLVQKRGWFLCFRVWYNVAECDTRFIAKRLIEHLKGEAL